MSKILIEIKKTDFKSSIDFVYSLLTSIGWFMGFKLHLNINDKGEILDFLLTPAHVGENRRMAKVELP